MPSATKDKQKDPVGSPAESVAMVMKAAKEMAIKQARLNAAAAAAPNPAPDFDPARAADGGGGSEGSGSTGGDADAAASEIMKWATKLDQLESALRPVLRARRARETDDRTTLSELTRLLDKFETETQAEVTSFHRAVASLDRLWAPKDGTPRRPLLEPPEVSVATFTDCCPPSSSTSSTHALLRLCVVRRPDSNGTTATTRRS